MNQSKVLVAGTGISGIAAAKLVLERGGEVVLYDGNTALNTDEIRAKFGKDAKVGIVLGEIKRSDLLGVELCIISPGIPLNSGFVAVVDEAGIPVLGEIELAYQCGLGKLAAITGTNGKTTTTALTGAILRSQYEETFVVGNIGEPYTSKVSEMTDQSVTVAEVSSFQLENIVNFHPQVSAVLNITPDHLNRHKTMECYTNVKLSVAKNQSPEDVVILNYEDDRLRAAAPEMMPRVLFFSSARELPEGAYLKGEEIFLALDGTVTRVCSIQDLNLLGRHNYENVMAAVLMAVSIGIPMDSIRHSLSEFRAVEHRIEFVEEKNGVAYYNDSKGTNVDAAIQAIRAMIRPTVLLGGGYDKGAEFDEWIQAFDGKVKQLILMGATARQIADTAAKYGVENIVFVDSMEEAVQTAAKTAEPGDAVLLSPACASWGMFPNYEVRGRVFKELVHAL